MLLALLAVASAACRCQTLSSATSAPLARPAALAYDATGTLYLAETNNHVIVRLTSAGVLATIAGTGTQGFSGDGGPATQAMLDSLAGLVLASGSAALYFSDTHNHRIRRVDTATGIISTVAGAGTPGFSGDGGPATQAMLDSPTALTIDSAGNLYLADSQNHRIRRIDAATGLISTVAGNGTQGFSGDHGPATLAAIDSPDGLAISPAGILYLADTHNHRIRAVNLATGIISTVAGTGYPGGSGDGLAAAQAALALPHGLTVDSKGDLYLADTDNHRIRRIDAATGLISTVVGSGIQGFAGDGAPATDAAMDSPRAAVLSPAAAVTLSDTNNQRVRQLTSTAAIATILGPGSSSPISPTDALTLTAPASLVYGTGTLTAKLASPTPATGSVAFVDLAQSPPNTLATVPLIANTASLSTGGLAATAHRIQANYLGDPTHPAIQSTAIPIVVAPAPAVASAAPATTTFGAAIPPLSGTLSGVLKQDVSTVSAIFSAAVNSASPPGSYPIAVALTGAAAPDYTVTLASGSGSLSIARAPAAISLGSADSAYAVSTPATFIAQLTSSVGSIPAGSATLLDNGLALQTTPISPGGVAVFTLASLNSGTHTLTSVYSGDLDFLPATSPTLVAIVAAPGPPPVADFTFAATGTASQTVQPGSIATFSFDLVEQGTGLSSPILLSTSGLPIGAVPTFSPAQVPPGTLNATVTLTIQAPAAIAQARLRSHTSPFVFATLLCPLWLMTRRYRTLSLSRTISAIVATALVVSTLACGNRVNTGVTATIQATSYPITVIATTTSATGTVLTHSTIVTLTVQ